MMREGGGANVYSCVAMPGGEECFEVEFPFYVYSMADAGLRAY